MDSTSIESLAAAEPLTEADAMTRTFLAALASLALFPAAASAGTITYDGDTLVLTAGPEANSVTFGGEQEGRLSIADAAAYAFPAERCTQTDPQYAIQCDVPGRIRVELGDGDDRAVIDHMVQGNPVVEVLGGAGDDELKAIAGNTRLALDGGPGNDRLRSEEGGDVLRGGTGDDELSGGRGPDVLEGGDGDDALGGDACGAPAPDVLDGGAGYDTLSDWGDCGPGSDRRPVRVTVNGVADDGRPGEGDDVRDLDVLQLFVPATVVGTDAANAIEIHADGDSAIEGRAGADDLRAGSGRETIDGGTGDDRIEGGWNHDTLTGGPGRDVIHGDSTAGNCGGGGQSCTIPFGNDTIDARDGEADQVDCGPGQDRVTADALDTVAADCEVVDRGLRVQRERLRTALRKGLRVQLPGSARVRVEVKAGARLVASGTTSARVRFTRAARRSLAKRRSVRLTVTAGTAVTTVTLRR
jgi:Ca2+-binding RTX toxin-like protein